MILILPAAFAALVYTRWNAKKNFTEGLVQGMILYHVLLLVITNVWSFPSLINKWTIFVSWCIVLAVTVLLGAMNARGERIAFGRGDITKRWQDANLLQKTMLLGMLVLGIILLVGALFTVPYNYDSMTYHLGRIGHWIDNGSVAHYVSCIDRQIYSPVMSEYEMLHMFLLNGNDSFLNLLQYGSMIVTCIILYATTRKLGTSRLCSLLASFLYMTMPLTISQAITTQNDLLASMWFAIFLYYFVDFVQFSKITFDRAQKKELLCIGAAVAFAFLTKSSICASMLFFMPWLLIVCIRRKDSFISLVKSALLAGSTLLVLISETLIRTYLSCGHLMADTTSANIMVATKNVKYILVNICKNYSLLITQHLFRPLNGVVYRFAIRLGSLLQVDFNNEAISYHGFDFLHHMNMGDDMYSHDKTPSAVVAYLALLAGIVLVAALVAYLISAVSKKKARTGNLAVEQADSATGDALPFYRKLNIGFVISGWLSLGFIMALLRWQPWGTRLMYPALAMMTVTIGHTVYAVFDGKKKVAVSIAVGVCALLSAVFCIRPVVYNMKPAADYMAAGMKDRESRYFLFNNRYTAYQQLLTQLEKLDEEKIGVSISGDGYDYPLWLMMRNHLPDTKLYHVILDENDTNGTDQNTWVPNYILYIEQGRLEIGEKKEYHGATYECVYVSDINPDAPDSILKRVE